LPLGLFLLSPLPFGLLRLSPGNWIPLPPSSGTTILTSWPGCATTTIGSVPTDFELRRGGFAGKPNGSRLELMTVPFERGLLRTSSNGCIQDASENVKNQLDSRGSIYIMSPPQ